VEAGDATPDKKIDMMVSVEDEQISAFPTNPK